MSSPITFTLEIPTGNLANLERRAAEAIGRYLTDGLIARIDRIDCTPQTATVHATLHRSCKPPVPSEATR